MQWLSNNIVVDAGRCAARARRLFNSSQCRMRLTIFVDNTQKNADAMHRLQQDGDGAQVFIATSQTLSRNAMVGLSDMTGGVGQAKDKDDEDLLLKMRAEIDEKHITKDSKGRGCSGKAKPSTTATATATNAVFSSAAANNYYQAIGYRLGIGSATSNNNEGKNISWKGLKEDASLDTSATKSEDISYKYSLGDRSITTLQEILAYAMEKGRTPAEVADYLSHVDEATTEVNNTHTEKLLAEALDNNKMYAEIVTFLLKAEEVKRKDAEGKTGMKPGGKTPAEIAVNLQKIEEEMKTRELVQQALKVCKTPKEMADYYLMKAGKESQIEDEQEGAKELVNKQGMIRSGVAAYLLMKAGQEKESHARPRSSAKLNSSVPLPVKSFHCNRATDELSTTSSVTNHLKSVPSIASVASSGCSIVTEIGNSNVDCSPSAVSQKQNKEKKSSSGLLGIKVPLSNRSKKTLQREDGDQDTSKATGEFETPEKVVLDKKDERKARLGAKLISEDLNGEVQEITLTMVITANCIESHSASDNSSSLWDNIEEKDKHCIDKVEKGKVDAESDSRPDVGRKVSEVGKDLKTAPLKGKLKRILTFKKKSYKDEDKRSLRKIDNHKPKTCGDSSDGTEETDTKSCFSNESASVKTEYDKTKADESSGELVMDGPITSITIPGNRPTIDDEVTLPSVLRRKSKVNIWKEPAVLKKWWSEVPTRHDDETEISQYSRDSVSYTRHSEYTQFAEQGCLCELKHEIDLLACEVREYCSATARSTKAGLHSVGQRASAMLGCDSTDLQEQKLPGFSSKIKLTQMEADDDEVGEIEIVRTKTNELKQTPLIV